MSDKYEQNIQWYPGHMTKTVRLIERTVDDVDAVMEIVDARLPAISRSPQVIEATQRKPRLLVLNKRDLADEAATRRWLEYYRKQGFMARAVNAKDAKTAAVLRGDILQLCAGMIEHDRERGLNRKPRLMVIGVPNCGKSTLINRLAGSTHARVEDRPGVTRGKQWVTLDYCELLDMPGVLCKKFADNDVACRLAFTGAIKDDILDTEMLAGVLLSVLAQSYPETLRQRYGLAVSDERGWQLLETVARRRGMLLRGGECDTQRAAVMVLDEYRAGKLGCITLEEAPE